MSGEISSLIIKVNSLLTLIVKEDFYFLLKLPILAFMYIFKFGIRATRLLLFVLFKIGNKVEKTAIKLHRLPARSRRLSDLARENLLEPVERSP